MDNYSERSIYSLITAPTPHQPPLHTSPHSSPAPTAHQPPLHTSPHCTPAPTAHQPPLHTSPHSTPAPTPHQPPLHTSPHSTPAHVSISPDKALHCWIGILHPHAWIGIIIMIVTLMIGFIPPISKTRTSWTQRCPQENVQFYHG